MSCIDHHLIDPEGSFSVAIYKLSDMIKENGYEVIHYDHTLPDNIAGRIDYKNKVIRINSGCAGCATIAIAHEAGHLMHFLECGDKLAPSRYIRETEAMKRGLKVLREHIDENLISDEYWGNVHK